MSFSPDTVTFAFDRTESTTWPIGVYLARTDSPSVHLLIPGAFEPSWDPTGQAIAFQGAGFGLARINLATDSIVPLVATGVNLFPSWSPNGSLIAFTSSQDNRFPPDLWIINATGGPARRIPLPGPPRTEMDDASWAPDGNHIVVSEGGRLFTTDTLGVDTAWITPAGSSAITPAWSPAGNWIAYVKVPPGNFGDLWLIHPDGSGDHRIVVSAAFPAWTPGGARIAFTRVGNGETALWSVDSVGQGLARLTSPAQ